METQEKILSAAEQLFANQGFDSTTIDQIAQEAGLTKGAVYYFFQNKADLFCRLVDPGIEYIEQHCRKVIYNGTDGHQTAFDLISCFVEQAYRYERIVRMLLGSQTADPAVQRIFDQRINRLVRCVEAQLYTGVTEGFLRPISVTLYAKLIIGMIYGLIALPEPPACEAAVRAIENMLRPLYR